MKIINIFTLMIFRITESISTIDVKLKKYDTNWPNCDTPWYVLRKFRPCDPYFQICLNSACINTTNTDNTNHIDFKRSTTSPNPAVFNQNYPQSLVKVTISVFDYNTQGSRFMTALSTTIDVPDFCKSSVFNRNLNGLNNTRLQIEVTVHSSCSSVNRRHETTDPTSILRYKTYPWRYPRGTTVWKQGTSEDYYRFETDTTRPIGYKTNIPWKHHRESSVRKQETSTIGVFQRSKLRYNKIYQWWYPSLSTERQYETSEHYDTTETTYAESTLKYKTTYQWWYQRKTTVWKHKQTTIDTLYENYVQVNCQESNWYIRLYIRPLKQKFQDFNARDVYLGRDSCTGYESGDYIIFSEEYNSCLTDKSTSDDAVIYTNTLVYALHDPDHRFIIRDYRFKIKVECDMSKRENGGNTIKHNHGQEDHTAAGTGHFSIHLNFYSDSNYQNLFNGFPPSYVVGDVVYVKVQTNMHDYDIKMRLSDCYTKPSEHASTIYTYYLIRNGCPVDRNTFVTSQSTHETRFHFQDFEYAGHPDSMFVHCNATFCKSIDYSAECEPQCKHSKRIGHHKSADQNLNGPIEISDDETKILFIDKRDSTAKEYRLNSDSSTDSSSKLRPLYVAGVIIVVLAMICILVALSIYFRRKKIRNTPKIV